MRKCFVDDLVWGPIWFPVCLRDPAVICWTNALISLCATQCGCMDFTQLYGTSHRGVEISGVTGPINPPNTEKFAFFLSHHCPPDPTFLRRVSCISAFRWILKSNNLICVPGPSKSDSALVRGDLAYEPAGLRIQQSLRRDVAQRAGGSWWLSRCCG